VLLLHGLARCLLGDRPARFRVELALAPLLHRPLRLLLLGSVQDNLLVALAADRLIHLVDRVCQLGGRAPGLEELVLVLLLHGLARCLLGDRPARFRVELALAPLLHRPLRLLLLGGRGRGLLVALAAHVFVDLVDGVGNMLGCRGWLAGCCVGLHDGRRRCWRRPFL